ncbi:TonB-dependent receptor [Brevundimonas sp. NPDC092305]|uniref:TonB-dependent receptor n=1 Tax=Brevundimonas sp. NPDC092305 TaxID=3363957 RepID=UPI00382E26BF
MTTRADTLRALLFASSAAGMLMAQPALAGDPAVVAEPQGGGADAQDPTDLGTVNVDGKRAERKPQSPEFTAPLVNTPRAVTIIPQQIIEQTNAMSLQDILQNSPGISFGAGEGGQPLADRPFIRGQSSGNNIFLDGVRDTGGQQREVFNLEQVEVVKGPDSVYSGRGSGGGSINLASKSPRLQDFTNFGLGVGTDGYLRGVVDQNWALGDNAGLRLNLMGAQGDVPGRDSVDYSKWGLGLSIGAGLGQDTSGTFSYYHLTSDQMPDYGIPLYTKLGGATAPRPDPSGILDVPYDSFYGLEARDYLTNEVDAFTFDFRHAFNDNLRIRNVSRYAVTLNDYVVTNPGDGGSAVNIGGVWWMKRGLKNRWNPAETWANVTDLTGSFAGAGMRHDFNVGLELGRERNRNASYTVTTLSGSACPAPLTGFDCTPVYDPNPEDPWTGTIVRGVASSNVTETVGLYALDSISLGERFIINLGVRHDIYAVDGLNPAAAVPADRVIPRREWEFTNYQAGLVFKPTASSSIYASYATSSTPPTLAAGDQNAAGGTGTVNGATNVVLDPEDTESFEVGAKVNLFGDRLALSAAAYQLSRKNAVIRTGTGANDFQQAGEVEVKGVELGVSGNITPNWTVFGGYSWTDSELVRGACTVTGTPPVCVPSLFEGDPLANTPEHSASLFTTYRVTPRLALGGGVYYVGETFGGNQGGAGGGGNRIYMPEWTRLDLFASYDVNERSSLQLNVKNATDEEYIMRTNGVHHADVAPGAQAILTLNLRY